MKTSLDHLPDGKRREVALISQVLQDEFASAIAGGTMPYKRNGRILKIVLYGSHARGDWVNDPVGGYISDYDLLVVVNDDKLTDVPDYWAKADARLLTAYTEQGDITAPASFIVHSRDEVNKALRLGRPFFVDIVRDGVAVFEPDRQPFDQPAILDPAEALRAATDSYKEWFETAVDFLEQAKHAIANDRSKVAAFELHQAAERFYHCALLVRKLYSPKSHKLNFLRAQAEQNDPSLTAAWPRSSRIDQRRFELLRRAYVEARYSPQYVITEDELAWLAERVGVLQELVRASCEAQLEALRVAVGGQTGGGS